MQLSAEQLHRLQELDPEMAKVLIDKMAQEIEDAKPSYIEAMFGPQRRFFLDPAKRKVAVCSRRAGKSFALGLWLYEGGMKVPGGTSVYIARSRSACRMIMALALNTINEQFGLKMWPRDMDNQIVYQLTNGHRIYLQGCKDSSEVNKWRGLKLTRACIDEAASMGPFLQELVEEVLEPALLDLDGELCMISTPGPVPQGYFHTVSEGDVMKGAKPWSHHHWTTESNPHIQLTRLSDEDQKLELLAANEPGYINKRVEAWLMDKCEVNGWDPEVHPGFIREWRGRWINDEGSLVFPYNAAKNSYYQLPEDGHYVYTIGVDVGYHDACAVVVGCYRRGHPTMYIVEATKREHVIPSALAAWLEKVRRKYQGANIVIDSGGLGKGYQMELHERYNIWCEPAKKRDKRGMQSSIRGNLLSGNIKIHPQKCAELLHEMGMLVWADDEHSKESDKTENHATDAFTYLVRNMLPSYRPEIDRKALTRHESAAKEMKVHKLAALKQVRENLREKVRTGQTLDEFANPQW